MSMAKPSNIFYVLRICETTTLRHLTCSSPLEIPLFSAQTSNKPEPYIYGWKYIKKHVNQNKFAMAKGKRRQKIKRERETANKKSRYRTARTHRTPSLGKSKQIKMSSLRA